MRYSSICMFQIKLGHLLTALMGRGVFERYPNFRVVFGESGIGWIPYVLDRMRTLGVARPDGVGARQLESAADDVGIGACAAGIEPGIGHGDVAGNGVGYSQIVELQDGARADGQARRRIPQLERFSKGQGAQADQYVAQVQVPIAGGGPLAGNADEA